MESFLMEKMTLKAVTGPVDLNTAANTGARIDMANCHRAIFVAVLAAGATTTAHGFALKQHNVASSGTPAPLNSDKPYFYKKASETVFTRVDPGTTGDVDGVILDEEDTYDLHALLGDSNAIVVFEVLAEDLTDGYRWVSLDITDTGGAQLGTVLAFGVPKNLPAYSQVV